MDDEYISLLHELEANIDYLNNKKRSISKLIEAMHEFSSENDRYGICHSKFGTLFEDLYRELLIAEHESSMYEKDLAKERAGLRQ